MLLDLTSLERAVGALSEAVLESRSEDSMAGLNAVQRRVFVAGVVQSFEFTYELCWKFIKRWLALNVGAVYVDGVTRKELFRMAAEQRLIDDVVAWWAHHKSRNLTSHTYDEEIAQEVFAQATRFLPDAEALLAALRARNDDA